jgi:hypothetical protein
MPRESIAMTAGELREFLAGMRWALLATLTPDGSPRGSAVRARLESERVCFVVTRGSQTHADLERDARACLATDQYPTYYEIKGASLHGVAEAVAAPETLVLAPDELAYALPLDDVVSFDFGKIERKF